MISAGQGPEECALAAARVFDKFKSAATGMHIDMELLEEKIQGRGLRSVMLRLRGKNLAAFADEWVGTVQWISASPLRLNHKRKNWFVHIALFAEQKRLEWDERDVRIETCRSSGPGGQNVNKVETAVRAIHLPSGVQVLAMDSRSQLQNKKCALERLRLRLILLDLEREAAGKSERWLEHESLQRGAAKKIFREPLL